MEMGVTLGTGDSKVNYVFERLSRPLSRHSLHGGHVPRAREAGWGAAACPSPRHMMVILLERSQPGQLPVCPWSGSMEPSRRGEFCPGCVSVKKKVYSDQVILRVSKTLLVWGARVSRLHVN